MINMVFLRTVISMQSLAQVAGVILSWWTAKFSKLTSSEIYRNCWWEFSYWKKSRAWEPKNINSVYTTMIRITLIWRFYIVNRELFSRKPSREDIIILALKSDCINHRKQFVILKKSVWPNNRNFLQDKELTSQGKDSNKLKDFSRAL